MNKKVVALVFFAICLSAYCSASILSAFASDGDSWAIKAPMPTARAGLKVAVVDEKIYAIGGFNFAAALGTNEAYDPVTDGWTSKKPLPTLRDSFGIAVCQNKIYVIGGEYEYTAVATNEVYDPATDSWETRAPMPNARGYFDANTVDGKIYLIGGLHVPPYYGGTVIFYNETLVYDPVTDSWTTEAAMPNPAGSYASAVIDNKIYIIGGISDGPSNRTQIYDTITDTWATGKPLPVAQRFTAAAATSGVNAPKRLYVIGGDSRTDHGNGLNQIYDPQTDNWTLGMNMTTPRESLAVAVLDDVLYALGGRYEQTLANNEAYFPASPIIPEYPSSAIPFLFITLTFVATVVYFRKRKQATETHRQKLVQG